MPVDGGGNFTRPGSPIPVSGQRADAPQLNVPVDDIYSGLNQLMFLDGRKSLRGSIPMNGYQAKDAANATDPQDYVTLAQMQEALASISLLYPGFLAPDTATSSAAPAGWIYANGAEISRSTYSALWVRVSSGNNLAASQIAKTHGQYGPGNGTTTFTIPNLYADGGYFIRPLSSGRTIGSLQSDEIKAHGHNALFSGNALPPHNHPGTFLRNAAGSGNKFGNGPWDFASMTAASAGTPSGTVTVNSTGGVETRPKNIAYPVLIKT